MNDNIKRSYDERVNRMKDVINKKVPDRIPIVLNAQTWIIQYAGISVKEALTQNSELLFDAYKKYLNDIYNDALLDVSNTATYKIADILGGGLYRVTDEWVQVVGGKGEVMHEDEYPSLISDPKRYIADVYAPRKFPILNQPLEKNKALFETLFDEFVAFGQYNASVAKRIAEEVGVPLFVNGCNYHPLDAVLDFLRDFTGTMVDIRRRPQQVYDACEVLYEYIIEMFKDSNIDASEDKMQFSPLHIPTYLNGKNFERFYFPFLKRYVQDVSAEEGYALYLFMENDWEAHVDYMTELPDEARIVMLFENGDLKTYMEKLGKKYTVMGGMPIGMLMRESRQSCIDQAKYCIDELASRGNYIFSTDRVPLSLKEAKPENMIAVSEYVRENGKY